MRIITGTAKGKILKPVPGNSTRPITDRAKEALFSILGPSIVAARMLDLFGGTGAVGLEALSRGAAHVTFVENNRAATRTIGENLRITGLAERAYVKRDDVFKFLRKSTAQAEPYDLIYMAPPQYKRLWADTLTLLDERLAAWLGPDGIVIAQIHPLEFETLELPHLNLYDQRKYGSTLLCFYERA
jgi:16S rRNA (guanine(966)-N(2))-methyltransferase RsmD